VYAAGRMDSQNIVTRSVNSLTRVRFKNGHLALVLVDSREIWGVKEQSIKRLSGGP